MHSIRLFFTLTILLVVQQVSSAQSKPNFGFERILPDRRPAEWHSFGDSHEFTADSTTKHQGKYSLKASSANGNGFGASSWNLPITFTGKKVTLTGYIKTQETGQQPNTYAGLWMRIDGDNRNALAFDNMQNRGIKGTTDWQAYTITLPIPEKGTSIVIGGILVGKGTAWFDDLTLMVDGVDFDKAPSKVTKSYKAQTDTAFNKGSGIAINSLSNQQIKNLATLGKVWGFVKYYHPSVGEGNHNMDAELFRVLPAVLKAMSIDEGNQALLEWLNTFAPIDANPGKKLDTTNAILKPDLAWLYDRQQINSTLQKKLEAIVQAKRSDEHYYIGMERQVGNPEFKHEAAYRQFVTPDTGYRLLALYRYWNIIQYFFPYKHLIGTDWNKILPEHISSFVTARDSLSYRLTALSLIGRVHDTHANLWGDQIVQKHYKGEFYAPVQVKHIEGQMVVTNYYNDSLGRQSGLQRGDVIKEIDGMPIAKLLAERKPYYPASNEPTRLRDLCRDLLRGHSAAVQLRIDHDGKDMNLTLKRYLLKNITGYNFALDGSSYPQDSSYKLLNPAVGYLFLGKIKENQIPEIMTKYKDTKGIIIDLRCYPSAFVVFSLGKYLMRPTEFVKFTGGSVQTPGLFRWGATLKAGQRGVDTYPGKVIILVNEVTQSSAEYHTMAFRKAANAVVLGSVTAAADGNVSPIVLPGGLQTMISGIGVNYPDGRETQRVGVGVDIEIHPTRQGIKENRDELLEKAIQLIQETK